MPTLLELKPFTTELAVIPFTSPKMNIKWCFGLNPACLHLTKGIFIIVNAVLPLIGLTFLDEFNYLLTRLSEMVIQSRLYNLPV